MTKFDSPFPRLRNSEEYELAKKDILKRIADYNIGVKKVSPEEKTIDHLLEYLKRS